MIQVRRNLVDQISHNLPLKEAALLSGILIGNESLYDESLSTLYRKIGLSHITVVSGSNVSFVILLLILFTRYIPKSIRLF